MPSQNNRQSWACSGGRQLLRLPGGLGPDLGGDFVAIKNICAHRGKSILTPIPFAGQQELQ
jgi:hypothetical protein